jgi:HD-GYP domain-containing protein (c-di-GMP phosphodiesterase class II)
MRLISLSKVKPGDILGQSIMANDGCIMLREGIVLTQRYIDRLKQMGVIYIYIIDSNLLDIKPEDPKFLDVKSHAVKALSTVFSKLQYSNSFEIKNTLSAITEMVEYLIENKEINSTYLLELKTFDNYTFVHSLNTCVLSLFFGVQMSYTKPILIDLGVGSLLHDIGKTKIPIDVLNKNGKLTDYEYELMKNHPVYGYEIVKNIDTMSERARSIVLEHHERVDGSGYPNKLKGDEISKFSKIACISDIYDAIVSDRVYRKGFPANEAYEFILGGCGTFFDASLVNVFKTNFSIYPLGVCVRLSNGLEGFTVGHNKGFPDRPIVRVFYDEFGNTINPTEINLVEKLDICIENIIV